MIASYLNGRPALIGALRSIQDDDSDFDRERTFLQSRLRSQIPVSSLLGVKVKVACSDQLILTAPLSGNTNHIGSAFAGSLSATAILTGWAWVCLLLSRQGIDAQVVLQDSFIRYLRSIRSDFEASTAIIANVDLDEFLKTLRRKARARLQVKVHIRDSGGPAVAFSGRYIASTS